MPQEQSHSALAARVQAHLAVTAEPWPDGAVDNIAELLRRAARRGSSSVEVAAELAQAATERQQASYDTVGFEAAIRAGHHLSRAAQLMRRGWSAHERNIARRVALDMYERAMCSPYPNTRAWAHLKTAYTLVESGLPKDAWHHAQMAEFKPETPAMAAYYDQLHAALRDRIKKSSEAPAWLTSQLSDSYA